MQPKPYARIHPADRVETNAEAAARRKLEAARLQQDRLGRQVSHELTQYIEPKSLMDDPKFAKRLKESGRKQKNGRPTGLFKS